MPGARRTDAGVVDFQKGDVLAPFEQAFVRVADRDEGDLGAQERLGQVLVQGMVDEDAVDAVLFGGGDGVGRQFLLGGEQPYVPVGERAEIAKRPRKRVDAGDVGDAERDNNVFPVGVQTHAASSVPDGRKGVQVGSESDMFCVSKKTSCI